MWQWKKPEEEDDVFQFKEFQQWEARELPMCLRQACVCFHMELVVWVYIIYILLVYIITTVLTWTLSNLPFSLRSLTSPSHLSLTVWTIDSKMARELRDHLALAPILLIRKLRLSSLDQQSEEVTYLNLPPGPFPPQEAAFCGEMAPSFSLSALQG